MKMLQINPCLVKNIDGIRGIGQRFDAIYGTTQVFINMEGKEHIMFSGNMFKIGFSPTKSIFQVDFDTALEIKESTEADVYIGEYTLTPETTDQVLLTKEKLLKENVTVKAVPKQIVDNHAGGQTVTIGG